MGVDMWFRRFLLAFALAFSLFAFSGDAMAQSQPRDPEGLGYQKTPADYQSWRAYFQGGETTCWGCTLMTATATATVNIGRQATTVFAGNAASAVAAFMGLWVMWQLYLMLSVSHANSPAQSIDTIFNRLVVMMVVLFILRNNPFTLIMEPFLSTMGATMDAAQGLLPRGGATYGSCSGMGGGGYLAQGNSLLCSMQKELGSGLALGTWMMSSAEFNVLTGTFDVQQWSMGLVIICVFFFMIIILPFRFFDALIRIATIAAILPVVVLAFLFKPTRGAVKQAVTSLLTAMLMFVFTAIAMSIAIQVLEAVTANIYNGVNPQANGPAYGGITGSDFMVLLTATLGMASMLSSAGSLAAEFAGFQGQMGNAGSQGANMITGAANLAGKAAGGAAGAAFTGNRVAASIGSVIKPGSAG